MASTSTVINSQKRKRVTEMFREQTLQETTTMRMKAINKSGDRDSVAAFKSLMQSVAEEVKIALNNLDEVHNALVH